MNLLARIISALSNPLIISAPLSFSLVFKTSNNFFYAIQWTFISLIFAAIVGLFVFYGVETGFFSDFDISKRRQRTPIFIFAAVVSIFYLLFIFLFNGPTILLLSLGALLLGVLLDSLINRKVKASIHLAVYSSFSIIIGILYGGLFWFVLFLAPLVAWSRIKLRRHIFLETVIGTLLGASLVIVLYFAIKYVNGY